MSAALAFYLVLYLVGLLWASLARQRLGMVFCCVAAFPLGQLIWVLLGLTLLVSPLPYQTWTAAAGVGALLAVACAIHAQRASSGPSLARRDGLTIAICSCVFAVLAWGIAQLNITNLTFDSHQIIILGRSLAFHGGVTPDLGMGGHGLDDRAMFQLLVQSAAIFLDTSYLYAVVPLSSLALLGLFACLSVRCLASTNAPPLRTAILVGLTVASMTTTYFVLVMMLSLYENFPAGGYLAASVACFFLADRERSTAWLGFAHLFLLAFALQRTEAPFLALVFLAIAHAQSRLPKGVLLRWLIAYCGVIAGWNAYLAQTIDPAHSWNPRAAVVATGVLATTLAFLVAMAVLQRPGLARLRRRLPELVVGSAFALFAAAYFINPEIFSRSIAHALENLTSLAWGGIWFAFALLGVGALALPRLPLHRVFSYGTLAYVALLLVAPVVRGGAYRLGWGDSGNRMLVHVVPLLFLYFLLVYGQGAQRLDLDEDTPAVAGASSAP